MQQLVWQGCCAAVLPSLAVRGLESKRLFILPFAPLADYGRSLVLHWNPLQMRRRGIAVSTLKEMARLMVESADDSPPRVTLITAG